MAINRSILQGFTSLKAKVIAYPLCYRLMLLAGVAVFFYATYGIANTLTALRASVPEIAFEWEHKIPFIPWSILPYWSLNLLYGCGFFLIDKQRLPNYAFRLILAQLIAIGCFLLFPLTFSEPKPATEGLYAFFFTQLGAFDKPFNQAPSLHIILSIIVGALYTTLGRKGGILISFIATICAFCAGIGQGIAVLTLCALLISWRWEPLLVWLWFSLIGISVLTTWQHHFIDIPTGIAVGGFVLCCLPNNQTITMRLPDKKRLKWAGFYTALSLLTAIFSLWLGGAGLWLLYFSLSFLAVGLAYGLFGQALFGKQSNGEMNLSAKVLFFPYLIIANLNARLWLRHKDDSNEILPEVYLGSILAKQNFEAVCDFSSEFSVTPSSNQQYQSFPLLDMVVPSATELNAAANILNERIKLARQQNLRLLVCCALGYSRSAAVLILWLIEYQGMQFTEAKALVTQRRPIVLSTDWQTQIIQAINLKTKEHD